MINPNLNTNLRDQLAQGHNVGDVDVDASGNPYRWTGVQWEAQGGGSTGGGGTAAKFNFDWTAARQQAFDALTPYYQQKLDLAKGDVALAKQYIEQDYQRGLRYTTDTYNTTNKFNTEEEQNKMAQEQIAQQTETRDTQGKANERGVYAGELAKGQTGAAPTSSYYQNYIGNPMTQSQQLRTQAIQRALQRQTELAGISQTKDVGELQSTEQQKLNQQDTTFRNYQLDAAKQQRDEAYNQNAPLAYQQAYAQYRAANNMG